MKKLKYSEMILLVLTLSLVVLFIAYQYGFKPLQEGSFDTHDQLRVDGVRLAKASQMIAQKTLVETRYKNLTNLVGVFDSQENQTPLIIAKIESAARDSNVHIANIQPQKPDTQKALVFLGVEVEIDGEWPDMVRFIGLLQQPPNFYFLNELNLEKYSGQSASVRGRMVISRMFLADS